MSDPAPAPKGRRTILVALLVASALAAFAATALLVNIFERKQEARNPWFPVVALTEESHDPADWGRNFPHQHDGWSRTVDQVRTRYGGSEALPRTPTDADPRSIVAQSRLEEDPRLKAMWAGYAFSVDFREERGHAYMLLDQTFTERQQVVKQPGACIHCHASVVGPYREAGGGDLVRGFEHFNAMPYSEVRPHFEHPVACIDCHDPETMSLRVTRPGFMEGIVALKAAQGQPGWTLADATRQEMRSYVCGQCHVEYHFRPPDKRLVYPWSKGLQVQDIVSYYDEAGFADWTHALTGAKVLKAQHPEFEMWSQGVHARSGVACADCHMPYQRVGAAKVSDHHVRSPLLMVNRSCQPCHPWPEEELLARAHAIQSRTHALRGVAMDALVGLIGDLEKARASGATDERLAAARDLQRRAQFYLDFVEAENSMGFHAPGEALRILGESIDFTRRGQLALRDEAPAAPQAPAGG